MIEKIRRIVKQEADPDDWNYHIKLVVKNAKKLAKQYKADQEIVEISALLRDIGRVRHGPKNHDQTGAEEAEKILKSLDYPDEKIKIIMECILMHRSRSKPKTVAAKIVHDADSIAHFDAVPGLLNVGLKYWNLNEAIQWTREKLRRDWQTLCLEESRDHVREKYNAAMLLLKDEKHE